MNIDIRRVEPGDYKALCELHAQPNALRGTLQLPFPSEEKWKERLAKHGDHDPVEVPQRDITQRSGNPARVGEFGWEIGVAAPIHRIAGVE